MASSVCRRTWRRWPARSCSSGFPGLSLAAGARGLPARPLSAGFAFAGRVRSVLYTLLAIGLIVAAGHLFACSRERGRLRSIASVQYRRVTARVCSPIVLTNPSTTSAATTSSNPSDHGAAKRPGHLCHRRRRLPCSGDERRRVQHDSFRHARFRAIVPSRWRARRARALRQRSPGRMNANPASSPSRT